MNHYGDVSKIDGWKIPLTYLGSERFIYRHKPERSEI